MEITQEHLKNMKKRGYFFDALEKRLSAKYSLSREIINEIRRLAIYKKLTQQEICIKITTALQTGAYKTTSFLSGRYNSSDKLVKLRTEVLTYLLRSSPDVFLDITQLTKYDYEYQGDDKKVPSRETWRDYLNNQKDQNTM